MAVMSLSGIKDTASNWCKCEASVCYVHVLRLKEHGEAEVFPYFSLLISVLSWVFTGPACCSNSFTIYWTSLL